MSYDVNSLCCWLPTHVGYSRLNVCNGRILFSHDLKRKVWQNVGIAEVRILFAGLAWIKPGYPNGGDGCPMPLKLAALEAQTVVKGGLKPEAYSLNAELTVVERQNVM